ncbi:cytochrome c oxidase subunit II [Sphingomonas sabuli]|uniref:Cytochrome c oxidase subunit 2 n=1 Tax=Sphingomonas sabuli TaxID=2764186 RepID=A0A7G9KZN8_9SPHN|nr:cytochrome c oxidase subunit II [Sphingomonas sabuli]QNM81837.1 cytochrome c oxidase subunit II [Sphingomonas sabuli]
MKLIGWAIALAAAMATPAAAQQTAADQPATAQQAAEPAAAPAADAAAPTAGDPAAATTSATADTPVASPYAYMAPAPGYGVPVPGATGTQKQVTEVGRQAAAFHDFWLLLLCAAISVFVLGLLLYTIVRYRRSAHPVPTRTSHNTTIEVIWTVVPVLILVAIAIPSIGLLREQYSFPKADVTIKVIGNQWYWTYQYPDNGDFEIVSNILKEPNDPTLKPGDRFRTDKDGPPLLAVDERIVIPAGKVVKFIVTSNDVIHSFAVPAFWSKIDANPGQLNETWVKVDRPGVYFGQCSELCGARHGYMPIAVEVVPPERFAAWVASKGGTMPGPKPVANPAETLRAIAKPAAAPQGAAPAEAQPNPPTPSVADRATAQN